MEGVPGPAIITLASGKKIMWRLDEDQQTLSLLGSNFSRVARIKKGGEAHGYQLVVHGEDALWTLPPTSLMTQDMSAAKRTVEVMYTLLYSDSHKDKTRAELRNASRVAAQLLGGGYNG